MSNVCDRLYNRHGAARRPQRETAAPKWPGMIKLVMKVVFSVKAGPDAGDENSPIPTRPGRKALNLLWLLLGGGMGTMCRYFINEWALPRLGSHLPYGTLGANLLGCLLIGLLLGVFESRFGSLTGAPTALRLLLITGFLGGLTTFSTYELEAFLYLRDGLWGRALAYLTLSIVLGLAVLWAGFQAGRLAGGLRV